MMRVREITLPDLRPYARIGVASELERLRGEITRLEFMLRALDGGFPGATIVEKPTSPAVEESPVVAPPARRSKSRRRPK
jgi:hypothetical protein